MLFVLGGKKKIVSAILERLKKAAVNVVGGSVTPHAKNNPRKRSCVDLIMNTTYARATVLGANLFSNKTERFGAGGPQKTLSLRAFHTDTAQRQKCICKIKRKIESREAGVRYESFSEWIKDLECSEIVLN